MGRVFAISLDGLGLFYSCKFCLTHLALVDDILSKSFYCRHGRAYLFNKCVNVTLGEKDDRMMMTGVHTVADIFCVNCGAILGWKYETAYDKSQQYKEGKFILERFQVVGPDGSNNAVGSAAHVLGNDPALSFVLQPTTVDSDAGTE